MTNLQFDRQLPKSIKWSPWHLAMSIVDGPVGDRIQQACKVFQKSQNQPAVYEVSVQTEKKKKVPCYVLLSFCWCPRETY